MQAAGAASDGRPQRQARRRRGHGDGACGGGEERRGEERRGEEREKVEADRKRKERKSLGKNVFNSVPTAGLTKGAGQRKELALNSTLTLLHFPLSFLNINDISQICRPQTEPHMSASDSITCGERPKQTGADDAVIAGARPAFSRSCPVLMHESGLTCD